MQAYNQNSINIDLYSFKRIGSFTVDLDLLKIPPKEEISISLASIENSDSFTYSVASQVYSQFDKRKKVTCSPVFLFMVILMPCEKTIGQGGVGRRTYHMIKGLQGILYNANAQVAYVSSYIEKSRLKAHRLLLDAWTSPPYMHLPVQRMSIEATKILEERKTKEILRCQAYNVGRSGLARWHR